MASFILDTCSLNVAASSVGRNIVEQLMLSGHRPLTSTTVLCEMFEKLGNDPTHGPCVDQCRFVLEHWDAFQFLPDTSVGLVGEYEDKPLSVSASLDWSDLKILKKNLEMGADGDFPHEFAALRRRTVSLVRNGIVEGQRSVLADMSRRPAKHTYKKEVESGSERDWKTTQIILGYGGLLGLKGLSNTGATKRARVERLVWELPGLSPYWSGVVRLTLFHDWFHDNLRLRKEAARKKGRTKPLPEEVEFVRVARDLFNMVPCLAGEAVITEDRGLRRFGQHIFPEIKWASLGEVKL